MFSVFMPSASVFNTSHGTWRMLMHENPCLIPILCATNLLSALRIERGTKQADCFRSYPIEYVICYMYLLKSVG